VKEIDGGSMKTFLPKIDANDRQWHLVDAQGKVLGRVATQVARLVRGKHKPIFTPHMDTGDFVVIINAEKVVLTGKKLRDKTYYRHSGYPGGIRATTPDRLLQRRPEDVLRHAIRGMLPKTRQGDALLRKVRIYSGASHPHGAQRPRGLALEA
jgi:large subunit ribosomal protein L13